MAANEDTHPHLPKFSKVLGALKLPGERLTDLVAQKKDLTPEDIIDLRTYAAEQGGFV